MSGDVERLAEVIGDHYDVVFFNGVWCCSCLLVLASHKVDAKVRYYRHLADAVLASGWLAAHDAEVAARAWDEGAQATGRRRDVAPARVNPYRVAGHGEEADR